MEFDDDFDVRDLDTASMDFDTIRKAVLDVIRAVGEDPDREGLVNTPDRVSRMYAELLSGYSADPEKIIKGALFNVDYDEMVLVRDIDAGAVSTLMVVGANPVYAAPGDLDLARRRLADAGHQARHRLALLQRRRKDADTERLAQNQRVARLRG